MNVDARVEHFIFKLSKPAGKLCPAHPFTEVIPMRQALVPLLLCCAFAAQAEEKALNLYSWSAYLPEKALQRFKDETGITVKYDIFDSAEALDSKLLTGGSGYDVVFPASSGLARAIQAKAVQQLDRSQLQNLDNIDGELLGKLA